MPILFSPDGSLTPTTKAVAADGYAPIAIGQPVGVELRTFYPGPSIREWNNKAELMLTSQVRDRPTAVPPPQRVNVMIRNYNFRLAEPVHGVGGHDYGDMMLHYTKSYTGGLLGLTVRGVELDRIGRKRFTAVTSAMQDVGALALFSSAAPYLAAASLAANVINLLTRAFSRNDPVLTVSGDLRFNPPNGGVLQSGRYLLWAGTPAWRTIAAQYELDADNVLVRTSDGGAYAEGPYLVLEVDARPRPDYDDFAIGAQSAELLEQWGDKDAAGTVLNAIVGLGKQVNDAKQLSEIRGLLDRRDKASSDEERAEIQAKIAAHAKLFTDDNAELLRGFLAPVLGS